MEAQRLKSLRSRVNDAIEAFKDAIRLDPTAAEPHADLGEIYFYQARYREAEREALEAMRLDPQSVDGHKLLARLYVFEVRLGKEPKPEQIERAIRAYEGVTKVDSTNAEAWAFLADLYQAKNDTARQIHALERWAATPAPTETGFYRGLTNSDLTADNAFYQLSQLYLREGRNQQAVEAARRAYELDPDSNIYSRNLISVLRLAASGEDELRIYSQLSKTANTPTLQIGYGSALVRAGRYQEAVERLRDYVKHDPTNTSAIGLLSVAQRRANQRAEAIETLKSGIARGETSVRTNLMLELAETYDELGRADEAMAQYEQVFESFLSRGKLTPQATELFANVVTRLSRVYRRTGQKQKLLSVTARARQLLGEHPLFDSLTIELLREEGKRREALEATRSAARRFPEDRAFKLTEALILGDLGNYQESIELLRGMIKGSAEEAAEDASVLMILSSIQMQGGQLREAEATVRKALELNARDADLLIQLSSVQDRAGQHRAAEQTLREVLEREPENATALNNLGYFLLERGERLEEALKLIERAVSIEPINGSFLDSLGWAHYKLGQLEQARAFLEKAASYSRHNPTVYEHLGDVLRDLGRVPEARRHWERALEYSIEADEIARLKDKLKK
jgi:tetratricopeptide (TPR) repeat protein